ncbi:MAG: hypothetical protein ACXWMU_03725 [Candidatus Limnocylindrales bacterium]
MPKPRRRTVYRRPAPAPGSTPGATAAPAPAQGRPTAVSIDLTASAGRPDLSVGDHVRLIGGGLYAGENAVIEKLGPTGANGAAMTALVRTEAGRSRTARTIDLEPVD